MGLFNFKKEEKKGQKERATASLNRKYTIKYHSFGFSYSLSMDVEEDENAIGKLEELRAKLERQRKKEVKRIKKEVIEMIKTKKEIEKELKKNGIEK